MCVGVQGGGGEWGRMCVCVEVKIEGEEPFCCVFYAL